MSRPMMATIPDDKFTFFSEQLYRELSHMFEWKGLPTTVPQDYLERNLIRHGYVLFYYDDNIGEDVLRATVQGHNRHDQPTTAKTHTTTTNNEVQTQIVRNIKRLTDGKNINFNKSTDGVLISNMEKGQSCKDIVEHYAYRLALIQQAFDTNVYWQNIPYFFQVESNEKKLSIEKMFTGAEVGKPFTLVDKHLFSSNADRTGVPTNINFTGKELMDARNELMMKFRENVGIETTGVDKAERVGSFEVSANVQHTKTVLQIMLEQRQIACENINKFFNQNISVDVRAIEHTQGGEEYGTGDGGTTPPIED